MKLQILHKFLLYGPLASVFSGSMLVARPIYLFIHVCLSSKPSLISYMLVEPRFTSNQTLSGPNAKITKIHPKSSLRQISTIEWSSFWS